MNSLAFLVLFAAEASISLYTGPRPEETAVYQHWIMGCDNVRNCAAVALQAPTAGTDGDTDHLEAMMIDDGAAQDISTMIMASIVNRQMARARSEAGPLANAIRSARQSRKKATRHYSDI